MQSVESNLTRACTRQAGDAAVGRMNEIINFKMHCKSCGKEATELEDGHCAECIVYFHKQWYVDYGELANQSMHPTSG